jgi:hypothetical protein
MFATDRRSLAVTLAGLAIAALAEPAYAIPLAAVANIEVTAPPNPTSLDLRDGNTESVVAIGGSALDASTSADASVAAGSPSRLHIGDELAQAMAAALKEHGLNVSAPATAPQSQTAKVAFVIEEAGYERRVWGKIGPKLTVRVRLLDAGSGDRLWGDTYKYDRAAMTIGWTMLRPPDQYAFESMDDVTAHPETVTEGLRTGIRMIAERAAEDLIGEIDK